MELFKDALRISANDWNRGPEGTTADPVLEEKFQGLKGLAHSRFGGPGENNPRSRKRTVLRPVSFRLTPRQHFRPSTAKRKVFLPQANPAAPNRFPTYRERKRSDMTTSKISKGLLLGLALLLATSVFAANNKGTLQISAPVTVNGKQLPAGDYTVRWDGAGPNVELNILRGKNVVATVPARMVDLDQSPNRDSVVTNVNSDGRKSLNEIRFSGKKYALAINAESAKAESNGTNK